MEKKKGTIRAIVGIVAAIVMAFGPAGTAAAEPAGMLKRCDFYVNNQCYDHWVPTRTSCKDIGRYGTADQLRQCLALFGFGVTKKP